MYKPWPCLATNIRSYPLLGNPRGDTGAPHSLADGGAHTNRITWAPRHWAGEENR